MKRWKQLYAINGIFTCPYCLKQFPIKDATKDHKNAKSRFHDNSWKNIVICCKKCNNEKGALTVEEYAEWKRLNFIRCGGLSR